MHIISDMCQKDIICIALFYGIRNSFGFIMKDEYGNMKKSNLRIDIASTNRYYR